METANLNNQIASSNVKKAWQTPELEVIDIKSNTEQELFLGFNLLGPKGTNAS